MVFAIQEKSELGEVRGKMKSIEEREEEVV